jgi:molybdopterin synthase sulfur carrier subunit
MEIRVQYFGMLAEITGQAIESLQVGEHISVGQLRGKIQEKYPELANRKFKIAVNLQISDEMIVISPSSEIALLPPFAGG